MLRFLGWLSFWADVFLDRIIEEAQPFHSRREERKSARRLARLRKMDAGEVRAQGDLGSLILARHIELAQGKK